MDLFTTQINENLLPLDGEAYYYTNVLNQNECLYYFNELLNTIDWKQDELIMFGKTIITKRKVAWYGDQPFEYKYSNTSKFALPWTSALRDLKKIVEIRVGETFNSCLLNLYHHGNEGMSWHADNEKELGECPSIASVSLGAVRKFSFKHKETKIKKEVILQNGSILSMKGTTQENWLHALPKTKKVTTPRINLTFRSISDASF